MKTVNSEYLEKIEEIKEILNARNLTKEEKEFICNTIENVYYRLSEAYASGRTLERILENNSINIDLTEYINIRMEEMEKFPFKEEI